MPYKSATSVKQFKSSNSDQSTEAALDFKFNHFTVVMLASGDSENGGYDLCPAG